MKKSALIFGATGEVGRAVAQKLLVAGYNLSLWSENQERQQDLLGMISAAKDKSTVVEVVRVDLSETQDFHALESSWEKFAGFDLVVLCAGYAQSASGTQKPFDELQRYFMVNTISPGLFLRKFLSLAKTHRRLADVIYVSSTSKDATIPTVYGITKQSFSSLIQILRRSFVDQDIRFCEVAPSLIFSNYFNKLNFEIKKRIQKMSGIDLEKALFEDLSDADRAHLFATVQDYVVTLDQVSEAILIFSESRTLPAQTYLELKSKKNFFEN